MRQVRSNAQGVPVISYLEGVRDGRPWADLVEVVGPGAEDLIMSELGGWAVSGSTELGERLLGRGARLSRHAHSMRCDLTRELPPAPAEAPEGFGFVPAGEHTPREVFPAWVAAYPPSHIDHSPRDNEEAFKQELVPLLDGSLIGPLLPCSSLAVDESGTVVGGVLVTNWNGLAWIGEVFRHPDRSPRGLGARLIRHTQLRAVADGVPAMGLAVTVGNSAEHVYARLGFVIKMTSMTVLV